MVASPNDMLDHVEEYMEEVRRLKECRDNLEKLEKYLEGLALPGELLEELNELVREKRRRFVVEIETLQSSITSLSVELERAGCQTKLHRIFEANRTSLAS